jgi:predicted dehydrogenase
LPNLIRKRNYGYNQELEIYNMKVLIIGAGRMGIRHATGALEIDNVKAVALVDLFEKAIETARSELSSNVQSYKLQFCLMTDIQSLANDFDVTIIAATAENRKSLCKMAIEKGCKNVLIEKPLGQSLSEIEDLTLYFRDAGVTASVNLSMRLIEASKKLKADIHSLPQFQGLLNITLNSGAVGIGAKGIHYLDFIYFLTNADRSEIVSADIDEDTIASGRGEQFRDFGGWCFLNFYKTNTRVAKAFISICSTSSVYGGFDIVGSHGRITINESTASRVDYLRRVDSAMPVQRYNADYNQPVESKFTLPFLGDLTKTWLEGIISGVNSLPTIEEAVQMHKLMFDWLSYSKNYSDKFPIT